MDFEVILSEENLVKAREEGLEKKFRLTSTTSTGKMFLLDSEGKEEKYDTPEKILEDFFRVRLAFYQKRKKFLLRHLKTELDKLANKVSFIYGMMNGDFEKFRSQKKAELFAEFQRRGYEPYPELTKAGVSGGYDYFLSLLFDANYEKIRELEEEKDKLEGLYRDLAKETPESMWLKDLDVLESQLEPDNRDDDEAEVVGRKAMKSGDMTDDADLKAAPKSPRKRTDNAPEVAKAKKARARKREAGAVLIDEDDDGELDLTLTTGINHAGGTAAQKTKKQNDGDQLPKTRDFRNKYERRRRIGVLDEDDFY